MESQQAIRGHLHLTVARRDSLASMLRRWTDRYSSTSSAFQRTATKAWIAQLTQYRTNLHFGRFRRALMLGAEVLGSPFVSEVDQAGILLAGRLPNQPFATCLRDLARYLRTVDESDTLSHLARRVQTYRTYHGLTMSLDARSEDVRQLLAQRPFPFGKTAVSMVNLCFLRAYFGFESGAEYSQVFDEHINPERFAEAVSAVIALGNDHLPLASTDFAFPPSGIDVSDDFLKVLRYGAARCALRDAAKLIRKSGADPHVYELMDSMKTNCSRNALTRNAIVGMGSEDESGELLMQRYRLRASESVTQRDFDDYLSDGSPFFQMFVPFMREYGRRELLMGGEFTLVHKTFAFAVSQEEWARHVKGLGGVQVSDERRSVTELQSLDSRQK